jgi:ATP-dependent RNA helicase SUPV3L1/SUV3
MPNITKSSSLEDLETNYKQFDLYFQVCRKFRIPVDAIEINDIKMQIAKRINKVLKENKHKYGKKCRTCGKSLPFGYQHGICNDCYQSRPWDY